MKNSTKVSRQTNKTKTAAPAKYKTVDEYLAALPANTRNLATEIRKTIKQAVPQAEEMISYNMPAFKLNGKGLVWYAAWKEHISLYPRSAAMDASIKELSAYEGGKGTIKFPTDRPLPLGLFTKIVKFKVAEIMEKQNEE